MRQRVIWWTAGAATLATGAVLGTWLLWPDPSRQRDYVDATACLLTDADGVTSPAAQPLWTAMQEASLSSHARVQYLAVAGPQTPANAQAHLNSLAGSRCGVVVAVGKMQTDAVTATAKSFPAVRFLAVDGGAEASNVSVVAAGSFDETIDRELADLVP
ncbi:MAG: BMP family ABC transporter substrate-binding protein [Actinomycetota bacterium]|nr:BMP family ABC transporter substrate-binding protein [Actinomycetota bacterium]